MGVGILAKRVVLELGSSTNFVYSLNGRSDVLRPFFLSVISSRSHCIRRQSRRSSTGEG